MLLLVIVEVLNFGDIFHFLLNDVGISIYCKRVVATTSLVTLAPSTSLILVFHTSLALVGGRLRVLATRYVNRRNVSRFILSKIFLLLFSKHVPLEVC